mmetsp:Transcript_13976/g.44753  ORF Transcript_13976/g.44753 Transcript_13976/m.44753 type:complete len:159 (-) Transcript_13976:136-612(-)
MFRRGKCCRAHAVSCVFSKSRLPGLCVDFFVVAARVRKQQLQRGGAGHRPVVVALKLLLSTFRSFSSSLGFVLLSFLPRIRRGPSLWQATLEQVGSRAACTEDRLSFLCKALAISSFQEAVRANRATTFLSSNLPVRPKGRSGVPDFTAQLVFGSTGA